MGVDVMGDYVTPSQAKKRAMELLDEARAACDRALSAKDHLEELRKEIASLKQQETRHALDAMRLERAYQRAVTQTALWVCKHLRLAPRSASAPEYLGSEPGTTNHQWVNRWLTKQLEEAHGESDRLRYSQVVRRLVRILLDKLPEQAIGDLGELSWSDSSES